MPAQTSLLQRASRPGLAFVDRDCRLCGLHVGRTQVVPAEGGAAPKAFFVGEAPGPEEDQQGRPFVGRAGKILRRAIGKAGWPDADVWITNAVKCFPHELRSEKKAIRRPSVEESATCLGHLVREVAALKPLLLIALGRTAAESVLGHPVANLGELRGRLHAARAELHQVPVWVTWHPSGLHYGHASEDEFTADLAAARAFLTRTRAP